MMTSILRMARVAIDPANRAAVETAYRAYVEGLADEPGTLVWELAADADDEGVVWIIAKFADTAAHESHMSSPAVSAAMAVLQDAMVGEPTMHQLIPLASMGS